MVRWAVLRTDTASNVFLVKDDLSEDESQTLVDSMTRKGHHQFYEAFPYAPEKLAAFLLEKQVKW